MEEVAWEALSVPTPTLPTCCHRTRVTSLCEQRYCTAILCVNV